MAALDQALRAASPLASDSTCEVLPCLGIILVGRQPPAAPPAFYLPTNKTAACTDARLKNARIYSNNLGEWSAKETSTVVIGVIDSGCDAAHFQPDFFGLIPEQGPLPGSNDQAGTDVYGYHGTNICRSIAYAAGDSRPLLAVAGRTEEEPKLSGMLKSLEWLSGQFRRPGGAFGVDLINLSIGITAFSRGLFETAFRDYWVGLSTRLVAAAGHIGFDHGRSPLPANLKETWAVGAAWRDTKGKVHVGYYSPRQLAAGTRDPDAALAKPDFAAVTGDSISVSTSFAAAATTGTLARRLALRRLQLRDSKAPVTWQDLQLNSSDFDSPADCARAGGRYLVPDPVEAKPIYYPA